VPFVSAAQEEEDEEEVDDDDDDELEDEELDEEDEEHEQAPDEDSVPEPTKPSFLERGLALVQVGAEWLGSLTQVAVQKAAHDIDKAMELKKERDKRPYHLVAVKGKQSNEFLYVLGAEADIIERRLRKEGWHVLRTPAT